MYNLFRLFLLCTLLSFVSACAATVAEAKEIPPTAVPEKVQLPPTAEVFSRKPPASCPVTVPQEPAFVPPAPYDTLGWETDFWYGSDALWTSLPREGTWYGLPDNPTGFTQKIFWWRDGYVWDKEPEPELVVTGERLDGKAPQLIGSRGTNAYAADIGSAMLVGVDFPTLGCWQITGKYAEAELSFVIWVGP